MRWIAISASKGHVRLRHQLSVAMLLLSTRLFTMLFFIPISAWLWRSSDINEQTVKACKAMIVGT